MSTRTVPVFPTSRKWSDCFLLPSNVTNFSNNLLLIFRPVSSINFVGYSTPSVHNVKTQMMRISQHRELARHQRMNTCKSGSQASS